eukprot:m.31368 g.31368  ORF g.31368 m.31368 type:complete len:716 (+) comp31491_c0_seq4:2533-4680(+)
MNLKPNLKDGLSDEHFGAIQSHTPEDEWRRLFHAENHAETVRLGGNEMQRDINRLRFQIKEMGLQGKLRSGKTFRSVCWRIFFGCLPDKRSDWISTVAGDRERYTEIKRKRILEPLEKMESSDLSLSVNNPLSQDQTSPWNMYFQDDNLRKEIQQDVQRTFPEFDFFKEQSVQTMQLDILFCYAKEHKELLYRQGMHELLAPILFVLDSDKRDSREAKTDNEVGKEMDFVMAADSVEHDAYCLFEALMDSCNVWYLQKAELGVHVHKQSKYEKSPFTSTEADFEHWMKESSPLARKLDRVQNKLLSQHDPVLQNHLESLGIAPQVYGIRWVRLLFGREFPLDDLLLVWDAIFAYSPSLSLVDYLCLAMLSFIRNALLGFDYSSCMEQLMHYPAVGDTHYLVEEALHLRNPQKYSKPPSWQYQKVPLTPLPVTKRPRSFGAMNQAITQKLARPVANVARHLIPKRSPHTAKSKSESAASGKGAQASKGSHFSGKHKRQAKPLPLPSPPEAVADGPEGRQSNIELEAKAESLEMLAQYCGNKMDTYLDILQDEFLKLKLLQSQEDNVLVALAGLKQLRDLLKGTLKLSGTIAEMEAQFDVLSPVKGQVTSPMTDPFSAWRKAAQSISVSEQSDESFSPPQLSFEKCEEEEEEKEENSAELSQGNEAESQTVSSTSSRPVVIHKKENSLLAAEMVGEDNFVFVDPLKDGMLDDPLSED